MAAGRTLANAWPTVARISRVESACPFCGKGPDALWHFVGCPEVSAVRVCSFPRLRRQFEDPFFLLFASPSPTHTSAGKAALFSAGLLLDAVYVARATKIHSPHNVAPLESLVRGRLRQLARNGGLLKRRIAHVTRAALVDP